MTERERVDYISGRIQALIAFAAAIAAIHPDRELLKAHFEITCQISLAGIETSLAGDQTIDGFQETAQRIFSALREWPGSSPDQHSEGEDR
jgi:hypothetical protein